MNLIDTHSHLYAEEFDENRDSLIQEAIESGNRQDFAPEH